jgi:hypothetical protein
MYNKAIIIIIIIIPEPSNYLVKSMLPLLCQVSHYSGGTAIRIDSNSAEGVFLALTQQTLLKVAIDNLWYNLGWARTALCS